MRCQPRPLCILVATLALCGQSAPASAESALEAPGLGAPGKLVSLELETGRTDNGKVVVAGRNASQQLLVTGNYSSDQLRDLTRHVSYTVSDAGIVEVEPSGYLRPLTEGQTTIRVEHESGLDANVAIQVTNIEQDVAVNFPNQIVPIFTKYGCNSGGCHGKSSGQNGFRLSLLGFEPTEDYEFLVKEGRGRRLFPSAPERSLLLQKAVAQLPHGGGQRIQMDSPSYRLIQSWIEQGMPYGHADDPTVARIEVLPNHRLMERAESQQLVVVAHFTDGTTKDVTRMTQFDSNDGEMAEVNERGLVTTTELTGTVAVMARYQGRVGVFRATVPLGVPVDSLPTPETLVDNHVFAHLVDLGLPPSEIADDGTFIRRVTVDLAGRLPTVDESAAFLADTDSDKRSKLIDRLLDGPDYSDYFANKWSAILRNKRRNEYDKSATFAFHEWIRANLDANRPYDEFVRELLTASGTPGHNPPVSWFREVKDAAAQVEDTAQLFLGLRIQCARCHHHPFEVWSQEDYYGFAAFFSRVGRKKGHLRGQDRIYHKPGKAQARNPKTNKNVPPAGLGAEAAELTSRQDPRHKLVDWMSDPENPFFAKAAVNRYWKHFFGRGLVDPEDDMRVTNPASNPELLAALADDFVASDFDLKHLIRTICNSRTYQLSSVPNEWNQTDKQSFSRFYPRRLNAEVLLDSINQVTGSQSKFAGAPQGTRAVQLPDNGFNSYFLTVFGRPEASSACECERSDEANLAQSLHLLNSADIQGKLQEDAGRAAKLAKSEDLSHSQRIRELYLLAFAREPLVEEVSIAEAHIEACGEDTKRSYEDIVWALINTKEFLFNH